MPVMLNEVLVQLEIPARSGPDNESFTVVDGTVGAGGHSQQILKRLQKTDRLLGFDRDPEMLARAAQVLADPRVSLHQGSYAELDRVLDELQIPSIDRVLLDLGLSSDQLADPRRGFGFDTTGELDMRFDPSSGTSARELLATLSQEQLTTLFRDYGEEREAAHIARELVRRRQSGQSVETVSALVDVIQKVSGTPKGQKSPSLARVFQALRIAANEELEQLSTFLSQVLPRRLRTGGRAVVITFHSLEDRMVKEAFRQTNLWSSLTKKPLVPSPTEVRMNPRSRSAKIRVAERTPNPFTA